MKAPKEPTIVLRLSLREARELSDSVHRAASALEGRAEDLHKLANGIGDHVDRLDERRWAARRARFRRLRRGQRRIGRRRR